jgi:hypothetical protein
LAGVSQRPPSPGERLVPPRPLATAAAVLFACARLATSAPTAAAPSPAAPVRDPDRTTP